MGRDKWKLAVTADVPPEPALVTGDLSHLQQAVENLLFNARDATFEMRNYLRDEAKRSLQQLFGGSKERAAQYDPSTLLARNTYPHLAGWFESGTNDLAGSSPGMASL